jgi:HEAT repeat protein
MAFRTALSRFIILNPVRMASSIYNVYTMGVSDSRLERASAVRKLGEDKLALAVADMIAQLDDPSLEVREEAAMALGSIGSPDAVDALLAKLQEPDCDLVPEITRALRVAKARRAAPVLRAKLGGVDRETTCEIVRTLGEIGDRDVAPDLIGLLRETNDTKVLAACSEALAHLGEFTAVYDILPRMKSTRNATLNRALTVALGDLLGERGGFYRVLSHERRTRGSETEPLLATVTQALVHVAGKAVERDKAAALVKLLDNAYMDGHAEDAVRLMVEVGQLITRVEFGVACPPGQTAFLIENLVCRDERFGVGIWFLGLLKDAIGKPPPEAPDDTDVLLGIYFLAAWARRYL